MPQREHYLLVCTNRRPQESPRGSCAARGSEDLVAKLKLRSQERGLAVHIVRTCSCSCLDCCDSGPVIAHEPAHVLYGKVSVDDVEEILDAVESGTVVSRLLLAGAAD
jgi:(2Fe-2S) ferredoxin